MSWLRLEAAFFQNPTIMRAGWDGTVVFLAAMTMSKLHNWDGSLPKDEFDETIVRRHLGCHSDISIPDGIASCLRVGLLTEDATHYAIKSWRKFQPDPTAARRKRKQRAREMESRSVTVRHSDIRESRTTGRDGTDGTNGTDDSLGSASRSGGSGKPKRLSAKQWGCVDGILDALCRGEAGTDAQQRALVWRRLRQAGALGDDAGSDILDRWLKRFPGAAADGKKKAGLA